MFSPEPTAGKYALLYTPFSLGETTLSHGCQRERISFLPFTDAAVVLLLSLMVGRAASDLELSAKRSHC